MAVNLVSEIFRKKLFYVLLLLIAGFWYFFYPHHVLYQEGCNLFLFTGAFAEQYVWKPGGWSEYAGLFLMQFFRYLWMGILLNVLALWAVQRSVASLFRRWGISCRWYFWTWLPALGLLGLQMNYDFLFSETLRVVSFFALLAFSGKIKSGQSGAVLLWGLAPVLLLLLGGGLYLLFYLLLALEEIGIKRGGGNRYVLMGGMVFAGGIWWFWRYVYLLPAAWSYEFFQDASRIRVVAGARILFYGFAALLAVGKFLPELKWESRRVQAGMTVACVGILIACMYGLRKYNYHPGVESLLHAELAVANENWKEMSELAGEVRYEIPTFVALTNLALAKEGQLAERMFEYPQVGVEGLLLPAGANYLVNLYGHEIFYHIGQYNEAYRYLFEAYNCRAGRVSGHILKRMAELLVRIEKPEAAKKILDRLKHSLFYRSWANGKLREGNRWAEGTPSGGEDFYPGFAGAVTDLMNMQRQAPDNGILQEYLLTACLLEKKIPLFYHFFTQFYPAGQTEPLPRHYEEALFIVVQTGLDKEVLEKYKIRKAQFGRLSRYTSAYKENMRNPEAARLMYNEFGDTYWYYYMYFKKKEE